MIVATAGHIDHGKTALVEALTGTNSDRLPEEQARGMSIDLGFAYTEIDGEVLGLVDVPGHERFVRNMLAGVTAVDCALLVVAADDGPMPQTREHLDILDLLGVRRGVVALTKIDRVDAERVALLREMLDELLAPTSLAGSPVFPVCAPRGEGIEALKAALLANRPAPIVAGDEAHGFRLAVDRSFSLTGAGLVVTGHVRSGRVAVDDRLLVSPEGTEVRVRGLHANDRSATEARAGQRCALNLGGAGARREGVRRGQWVVSESAHLSTQRLDARLRVLASEARALRHWTPVHLHLGTQDVTARVATLEAEGIEPGATALVRLALDRPLAAWVGDRFILRDQSAQRTIAGGEVLDALSPQRGRAHGPRLRYLAGIDAERPDRALAALAAAQPGGVVVDAFAHAWNLTPAHLEQLLGQRGLDLIGTGASRLAMAAEHWQSLRDGVVSAVATWHAEHPERAGIERERLRRALPGRVPPAVLDAALAALRASGALQARGALLCLPDHRASLPAADQQLWTQVLPHLQTDTDKPPTLPDLARALELDAGALRGMAERAVGAGLLAHVSGNRYFTLPRLHELARIAERLSEQAEDGAFSAAAYRDASGIGRNVSIELLEYFDRIGLTRRLGNVRKLRRSAAAVIAEHWSV